MKAVKYIIFSLLFVIFSCSSPTEKPEIAHNFQLRLDLSQLPASVALIRGQLSNSNSDLIVFNFDLDTISHTATTTVSEIPVGEWNLTVNALDENEIVTHSASTIVLIHVGLNTVNLVFEAEIGDIVIHVSSKITLTDSNFSQGLILGQDSLIPNDNTDRYSIIELYRPGSKYDNGLSFKFLESKYIEYLYYSRDIYSTDWFLLKYDYQVFYPNNQITSFTDSELLPHITWYPNYSKCEKLLYIEYRDNMASTDRFYLVISLNYGAVNGQQLKDDFKQKVIARKVKQI